MISPNQHWLSLVSALSWANLKHSCFAPPAIREALRTRAHELEEFAKMKPADLPLALRGLQVDHVSPEAYESVIGEFAGEMNAATISGSLAQPAGFATFDFNGELLRLPPQFYDWVSQAHTVTLNINSLGGSTSAAIDAIEALRAKRVLVRIHKAGSAAAILAQAGTWRVIDADASMMLHPPIDAALGNSANLRRTADELDLLTIRLVDLLQARTGQPRSTLHAWLGGMMFGSPPSRPSRPAWSTK